MLRYKLDLINVRLAQHYFDNRRKHLVSCWSKNTVAWIKQIIEQYYFVPKL